MDTKEAIEFLKLCKLEAAGFEGWRFEDVISLLQDLEKYKEIYREIERHISLNWLNWQKVEIDTIKQKYFPQPIKKIIMIEIKGENIDWVIESFKDAVENINREYKDKIKVNTSEVK